MFIAALRASEGEAKVMAGYEAVTEVTGRDVITALLAGTTGEWGVYPHAGAGYYSLSRAGPSDEHGHCHVNKDLIGDVMQTVANVIPGYGSTSATLGDARFPVTTANMEDGEGTSSEGDTPEQGIGALGITLCVAVPPAVDAVDAYVWDRYTPTPGSTIWCGAAGQAHYTLYYV